MRTVNEIRILFIDDDLAVLHSLRRFLLKEKYQQYFAASGQEALDLMAGQPIDIIVTDLRMPAMTGLELLIEVKRRHPSVLRLVYSATSDIVQTIESINTGEVFRFIPKVLEPEKFKKILLDAVRHYLAKIESEALLNKLQSSNQELQLTNVSLNKLTDILCFRDLQLTTIMDIANDAIVVVDEQIRIVVWNKAAEKMFGHTAAETRGKSPYAFCVPERFKESYMTWRKELFSNVQGADGHFAPKIRNSVLLHKNGQEVVTELSAAPAVIDGKEHCILIIRDLSHRQLLENTLKEFISEKQGVERRIEKVLLQAPPPTGLKGMEVATLTLSAGHLDGDFTDFICIGQDMADVVIGDVMGKGIAAALVASGLKSHLLKIHAQHDCTIKPRISCPAGKVNLNRLGEIISDLHTVVVPDLLKLEMFATLCYARFHLPQKQMAYVSCGHTQTVHYQAAADCCRYLAGQHMPLGMTEEKVYPASLVDFLPGDLFLFYSDGVTEAEGAGEEQFGLERLGDIISSNHQHGPEQLISTIADAVRNFTGEERFRDDFTCIVVKIDSHD
jgi:phosphoserine phosphatase RsbU/P